MERIWCCLLMVLLFAGTAKETEGRVRFSDAEGSVFRQIIPQGTYILVWLSSKDSVAEVAKQMKSWSRDGAVDGVVWGGTSRWTGCQATELPTEALANGSVAWFVPRAKTMRDFKDNANPTCWKSSVKTNDATPDRPNEGVDDSILIPKKE